MNVTSTQRKYFYDLITTRFEHTALWKRIEPEVALRTSDIPEPTTPEMKLKLITVLQSIGIFLKDAGIDARDLDFINEEIERHKHTRQISLYEEKEDHVDKDTLTRFCHLSYTQEGIIGVDKPYSYAQLRRITNGIYQTTGNIKFFISTETKIRGKIVAEIYDYLQEIPIARLVVPNKDDEPSHIALFGDVVDKKKAKQVREITAAFHVYSFIDQHLHEYTILSVDEVELGDYEVHGTLLKLTDQKKITESSRLPTKMQYIFLHHAVGTVVKYANDDEYLAKRAAINVQRKDFFNYPFVFEMRNLKYEDFGGPTHIEVVGKHPKWFKWLIWAWLCHSPQGTGERWPLPLTIIGPPNSGKTLLFERLDKISLESQLIFKGEDSSIKGVVPSFHSTPPKRGYLCDCRRFAFLDEFFRCLAGVNDKDERKESLARLNSLIEHKKCTFSTGKSSIRVQMSARAIFGNNPPRGVNNVEDLLETFDKAFQTRTLIYWQKENSDHVQMVKRSKPQDLVPYGGTLQAEDFISFIDYLWTFESRWKAETINSIYQEPIPLLTEVQRNHYESRHRHHLDCIADGVIKARALTQGTKHFVAEPEDYLVIKEIWSNIIKSWTDGESVKKLPIGQRAAYLPEASQWLWKRIKKEDRPLAVGEYETMALGGLTKNEFYTAHTILRSNGIINDNDGVIRPYYLVQGYKEEEKTDVKERQWEDEE